MKKLACLFLATALLLFTAACGNEEKSETVSKASTEAEHTHSYTDWAVEREPTCSRTGQKVRRCKCGHREMLLVSKEPHNFVAGNCTGCGISDPSLE